MKQQYELYTAEDHDVWGVLTKRQLENLQDKASSIYLNCIDKIGFTPIEIPNFDDVNICLEKATGWSIEVVPGLIEPVVFYELLASRKFCSSTWLRKMSQLDYLEEPDMFHDTFGHLPLLMDTYFANFAKGLGDLGLQYHENEEIVTEIQRLYWFTIEFGMIREANGKLKIYGAGILSSFGESNYALSNQPELIDFDIEKVIAQEFRTDIIQDKYFVIRDFKELNDSLIFLEKRYAKKSLKQESTI